MVIIDNVISMEELNRMYKFFTTYDLKFQTRSPTLTLQNMTLRHRGQKPVKYFPLARFPLHVAKDLFKKINEYYPDYELDPDFTGVLQHPTDFNHTPHYDFFEDQYIGKEDQMKRILFYVVPRWEGGWGGNTEFYGRWNNEKEDPDVCVIKPNRMVVFDWDEYHTGTPWNSSEVTRTVITLYIWKNAEPRTKERIYNYIWGRQRPRYAEEFKQ